MRIPAVATLVGSSGARALGSLFAFAATFLVTAVLGPKTAGVLYGTIAWASAIALLSRWGIMDRLLIELPPWAETWRRNMIPAAVNLALAQSLLRSLLWISLFLTLWVWSNYHEYHLELSIPLLIALIPGTIVLQLFSATGKAVGQVERSVFFEFALTPLIVVLVAAMMRAGAIPRNASVIGTTYVLATAMAAAACFAVVLRRRWSLRRTRVVAYRTKQRDRDFGVIDVANLLISSLPMLMLPLLLSAFQVGIFYLAFRLAAVVTVFGSALYVAIIPRLSLAIRRRDKFLWSSTLRNARVLMAIVGTVFVVATFSVGRIILGWAGHSAAAATPPLYIMASCMGIGVALGPGYAVAASSGNENILRNITLAATIVAVIIPLPLIVMFGITGAAWATGVTYLLLTSMLFVNDLLLQRRLGWQ